MSTNQQKADSQSNPASGTPNKSSPQAKTPVRRSWMWLILLVLLVNYLLARLLFPSPLEPTLVPYSLFKQEVQKGNIKAINSQGNTITGRFQTPIAYVSEKTTPKAGPEARKRTDTASPEASKTGTNVVVLFRDPRGRNITRRLPWREGESGRGQLVTQILDALRREIKQGSP